MTEPPPVRSPEVEAIAREFFLSLIGWIIASYIVIVLGLNWDNTLLAGLGILLMVGCQALLLCAISLFRP